MTLFNSKVCVIGDSHVRPLKVIPWINLLSISGATLSGVINPASKTDARNQIERYIGKVASGSTVIFCLGEVDVGFLWLAKSNQNLSNIDEVMDIGVANYKTFVDGIRKSRPDLSIKIANVIPTTMTDIKLKKSKIELRREINISYADRLLLVQRCNEKISNSFDDVVDLYSCFIKNMESSRYWHFNSRDHHFDSRFYVCCFLEAIKRPQDLSLLSLLVLVLRDLKSFLK